MKTLYRHPLKRMCRLTTANDWLERSGHPLSLGRGGCQSCHLQNCPGSEKYYKNLANILKSDLHEVNRALLEGVPYEYSMLNTSNRDHLLFAE